MTRQDAIYEVRKAGGRFHTQAGWLDSRHSFSFAGHYDPENTHHGLLLVSNDDWIKAGTGFSTHPHRDMEIVTWVLSGEIEHKDSTGNKGIIYPGLAQRMSAGSGILHSEINASKQDTRLVQMWVVPDTRQVDPSYEQLDISAQLGKGGLVPLASGKASHSAIKIRQKDATLWVGRLKAGELVKVPDALHAHVYLAQGTAALAGAGPLSQGDAVRLTAAGAPALTAGPQGAEVLIWEMNATLA